MQRMLFAVAALALATMSSATAQQKQEKEDVMVPVHQFVDGFNKGDVKSALGACADETSIIDEFPPYQWRGAGACGKWADAYDADAKKNDIKDGIVTLGTPRHIDVTGDHAYVVVPANYKFKQKGKPVEETGSTLTMALQKESAGWRVTAWTWSKH